MIPTQPPSEDHLNNLLSLGQVTTTELCIRQFNLPFVVENGKLVPALKGTELELKRFITRTPSLLELKKEIVHLAKCDDEILITGETGTGKEIIARALKGDRTGKFRVVNCGGLPEYLVESELFGHERGAFTGAVSQSQGMMAAAQDGLFFLDEIGELPLAAQPKLLRAIQERRVRMVGGKQEVEINCKIVCATHANLGEMVKSGSFRQDLYARISTFEIHLPPLRDRKSDYEPIISSMVGGGAFIEAMKKAGRSLAELDVQHNVRSLRQHVRRFSVLGKLPKQ
jgi:two-component system, NtrC family, response regulator